MAKASLTNEQQMRAGQLLRSGLSQAAIARAFGVSKDTINRLAQKHTRLEYEPTTLGMRLDALNVKLDRIIAETARNISQHRIAEA